MILRKSGGRGSAKDIDKTVADGVEKLSCWLRAFRPLK
jgi:hypothetical protein